MKSLNSLKSEKINNNLLDRDYSDNCPLQNFNKKSIIENNINKKLISENSINISDYSVNLNNSKKLKLNNTNLVTNNTQNIVLSLTSLNIIVNNLKDLERQIVCLIGIITPNVFSQEVDDEIINLIKHSLIYDRESILNKTNALNDIINYSEIDNSMKYFYKRSINKIQITKSLIKVQELKRKNNIIKDISIELEYLKDIYNKWIFNAEIQTYSIKQRLGNK